MSNPPNSAALYYPKEERGVANLMEEEKLQTMHNVPPELPGEEQSGEENTNTWPKRHGIRHGKNNPYSCMMTRCHIREGYCGGLVLGRGKNRGVAELYRPTRPADEVSCCVVGRGMTILACYLAGTLQ